MENDFSQYPRCTCSAVFPTAQALDAHLEENKSLEEYLVTRVEICKGHARTNDLGESADENADDSGIQSREMSQHSCPVKGCERMGKPFNNRQRLRRHYEQRTHVKCDEICVCCHRTMPFVRDFIRHAERHQDASRTKLSYIHNMCVELRTRAGEELETMEQSRRSSRQRTAKNRTHEVSELDSQALGSKRKRDEPERSRHGTRHPSSPDDTNYDVRDTFDANAGAEPMPGSNQLAQPIIPAALGIDDGINTLAGTQVGVLISNPIQAADAMFDDLDFDAPVNGIVNFPDFLDLWQA